MVSQEIIRKIYLENNFTYDQLEKFIIEEYGEDSVNRKKIYKSLYNPSLSAEEKQAIKDKKEYINRSLLGKGNPYFITEQEKEKLEEMIKVSIRELNVSQLLMVKTIYLFMLGISNPEIAKILEINPSTVSKQLRKKGIPLILTREAYQKFRAKYDAHIEKISMSKEDKYRKVKQAGNTYQEVKKNIQVPKSTYYRYAQDEEFHKIEVVDTDHLQKQNIDLNRVKNRNVFQVVSAFLTLESPTYEVIAKKCGFTEETVYKHLHDEKFLRSLFSKKICQYIDEKVRKTDRSILEQRERENKAQLYKLLDESVFYYLKSRKSYEEHSLKYYDLKEIIKTDFFQRAYGDEIIEKIRKKGEEVQRTHTRGKSDVFVTEPAIISLVRNNVTKVSTYEMKLLKLISCFFMSFGNINYILSNDIAGIHTYNSILFGLKDMRLKELLTEENYQKLTNYVSLEEKLYSLTIPKKNKFIQSFVETYYKYNKNIFILRRETNFSIEEVTRILTDNRVKEAYGLNVYDEIISSLRQYEDKMFVVNTLVQSKTKDKR